MSSGPEDYGYIALLDIVQILLGMRPVNTKNGQSVVP
jgi:hypothetical protein